MFVFNQMSENIDKFQSTDLKEKIKEMIVSFKISQNNIFVEIVVEGFLYDGHLNNFFGTVLFLKAMSNFVLQTSKVYCEV